jgi:hypothetical protein
VFEILTGTKFLGNYWDGDSVLASLREALFAPAGATGIGGAGGVVGVRHGRAKVISAISLSADGSLRQSLLSAVAPWRRVIIATNWRTCPTTEDRYGSARSSWLTAHEKPMGSGLPAYEQAGPLR